MGDKKNLFVSTSIAYVNGSPHVGFAMESIEADVIARWGRMQGRKTFFSTGTDEHGEKIQRTAEQNNTTPQKICDENAEEFKRLTKALHISNDDFIRTSDKQKHWPSVQKLWKILEEKGDVELRTYTAKYCYGCEEFKLEKDLDENGNCPIHLRPPEIISEENYFFCLSKYSQQIADLIESGDLEIVPSFRKQEILKLAKEGLHDVSFSRPSKKLPWGIPVPGDDKQNMYVWCDALTNYISVLDFANNSENFQTFWENGEVVHVIGKDIIRFHAGIWIGMLLAAGIKIPDKIFVHGFLTSEGHKMSKSLGNVVDPFDEIKKYGADSLRYFLVREVPIGNDADFSRGRFEEIYQAHLANGLGNLMSRVYNLCKNADGFSISDVTPEEFFVDAVGNREEKLLNSMEKLSLHEAIEHVFSVVDYCDKYINEKKPWELQGVNPGENRRVLENLLYATLWIQKYIQSFLPETSEKISKIFGIGESQFGELTMLFPRIEKLNLPKEQNNVVPMKKNISFEVSDSVKKMGVYAKSVVLQNIPVKKTSKGIQKFCKQEAKNFLSLGGKKNSQWSNRIAQMTKVKIEAGFSPEINVSASESLANLAEKNGSLPTLSNIVDLYNTISLKHGVSAGAHDCEFLDEKVRIDTTKGDEVFEPMKGKENMSFEKNPLQKGEYAFFISEKEIGCRFDSAQCEASKILPGNKNILVYFQAPIQNPEWADEAMNEFLDLLAVYGINK